MSRVDNAANPNNTFPNEPDLDDKADERGAAAAAAAQVATGGDFKLALKSFDLNVPTHSMSEGFTLNTFTEPRASLMFAAPKPARSRADILLRVLLAVQEDFDLAEGSLGRLLDKKEASIEQQKKFNDLITKFQNSVAEGGGDLTEQELAEVKNEAKALGIDLDTSALDSVMNDYGHAWASVHQEKFDAITSRLERELKSVASASSADDAQMNVGMTAYNTVGRQRNEAIESIKRQLENAKLA